MTEKKDRERVMAEITISYVLRLASEEGRAYEMWKHMMQAGEEFIASSLLQSAPRPRPSIEVSMS